MEENKKYRILGTLLYYMLRIISSTLKIEIINKYGINMQKPHIYGFWHSKLFITPIFFKDYLYNKPVTYLPYDVLD